MLKPCSEDASSTKSSAKKQMVNLAASNSDTLVYSAVTVDPSGSQPCMVCGPIPKTLDTCGPLFINRVLQYHGRAIW